LAYCPLDQLLLRRRSLKTMLPVSATGQLLPSPSSGCTRLMRTGCAFAFVALHSARFHRMSLRRRVIAAISDVETLVRNSNTDQRFSQEISSKL
jgi:hypothetical protein